jgi:hypothetical protein
MAMKDESDSIYKALRSSISQPQYLDEVTEPSKITLMQSAGGLHYAPHYEHFE